MKKVKIMLTAITVLAVVGGALAFKAKQHTIYCSDTATSTCPEIGLASSWVNPDGGPVVALSFCTVDPGGDCSFANPSEIFADN